MSNLLPTGHMPPRMAMSAAQHKIINLLKILSVYEFLLVFMYLICGPRQLFFFQRGSEMPKVCTSLKHDAPANRATQPGLEAHSFNHCSILSPKRTHKKPSLCKLTYIPNTSYVSLEIFVASWCLATCLSLGCP